MNYFLVFALVIVVVLLTVRIEKFELSGYTKPVPPVMLKDARPDLSGYEEVEAKIKPDMVQTFVLKTNKELTKRTNMCTYIIDTYRVRHYVGKEKDIYECAFMAIKKGGFSFGFSVVSFFEFENGKVRLISLRSQPMEDQSPSDVTPFIQESTGEDFIDYEIVKEVAAPKVSEFEKVKNKFQ